MSLKDKWKRFGKGMGKSFSGLGKSIVKSAKVGMDKLSEDEPAEKKEGQEQKPLSENWKEVGKSFGETGVAFGAAVTGTAKKVADDLDSAVNNEEGND